MARYYYKDPLKAAWMSKEFKFNFQIPHSYKNEDYGMLNVTTLQVDALEDGTAHCIMAENSKGEFSFEGDDPEDRYSGKYYIHPDCHDLLKPQDGDIGAGWLIGSDYYPYRFEDGKWRDSEFIEQDEEDVKSKEKIKIIMRSGKQWFSSESEE